MKALIKNALKSGLQVTWRLIRNTRFGLLASDILIEGALGEFVSVEHNGHILRFSAPNRLCRWRAQTFSDKEPETLEWIDQLPEKFSGMGYRGKCRSLHGLCGIEEKMKGCSL